MEETIHSKVQSVALDNFEWAERSFKVNDLQIFDLIQSFVIVLEISNLRTFSVIFNNRSSLEFFGYENSTQFNESSEIEQIKEKLLRDRNLTFEVKSTEILLHLSNGNSYKCWLTISPINITESQSQNILINIYNGVKVQSNIYSQTAIKHINSKISIYSLETKTLIYHNDPQPNTPRNENNLSGSNEKSLSSNNLNNNLSEYYFTDEIYEKLNKVFAKSAFGSKLLETEVSRIPQKQQFDSNFKSINPKYKEGVISKSDGTLILSPNEEEVFSLLEEQKQDLNQKNKIKQTIWSKIRYVKVKNLIDDKPVILIEEEDISESKRREQEYQLEKKRTTSISDFLANLSHEIRTPLNGILGMLQFLVGTKVNDEQLHSLNTAIHSTQALSQLLSDVLDLSKVEAGTLRINQTPISIGKLSRLLEDLVQLFSNQLHSKGLTLFLDFPLEFSFKMPKDEDGEKRKTLRGFKAAKKGSSNNFQQFIVSDLLRIRQVLVNLISNAIKYTNVGCIFIRLKIQSEENAAFPVKFEVQDTGVGIAKDKLQKVFHRFCRIENNDEDDNNNNNGENDNNSKDGFDNSVEKNKVRESGNNTEKGGKKKFEKAEGTGIGLTISKQITKLLQGDLSVSSTVGVGTTFTFSLPQKITGNAENNNQLIARKKLIRKNTRTNRSKSVPSMYIDPLKQSFSNLHYLPPPDDLPTIPSIFESLNGSNFFIISKFSRHIFSESILDFFTQNQSCFYFFNQLDVLSQFPQSQTRSLKNSGNNRDHKKFLIKNKKIQKISLNMNIPLTIKSANSAPLSDDAKQKVLKLFEKKEGLIVILDTKILFSEDNFIKLSNSINKNQNNAMNNNENLFSSPREDDKKDFNEFWISTVKEAIISIHNNIFDLYNAAQPSSSSPSSSSSSSQKSKLDKTRHTISSARLFLILPQLFASLLSTLLASSDIPWYSGWVADPLLPSRLITLITSSLPVNLPPPVHLSAANEGNNPNAAQPPSPLSLSNKRFTFLIADDNKVNQLVIKKLLTQLLPCIVIDFVVNGKESVELFKKSIVSNNNYDRIGYDMVMLDLNMPVMDGFEASKRIREVEFQLSQKNANAQIRTPIIGFTASTVSDIHHQCIDAGMDDVLNKPIMKHELTDFLLSYLKIEF